MEEAMKVDGQHPTPIVSNLTTISSDENGAGFLGLRPDNPAGDDNEPDSKCEMITLEKAYYEPPKSAADTDAAVAAAAAAAEQEQEAEQEQVNGSCSLNQTSFDPQVIEDYVERGGCQQFIQNLDNNDKDLMEATSSLDTNKDLIDSTIESFDREMRASPNNSLTSLRALPVSTSEPARSSEEPAVIPEAADTTQAVEPAAAVDTPPEQEPVEEQVARPEEPEKLEEPAAAAEPEKQPIEEDVEMHPEEEAEPEPPVQQLEAEAEAEPEQTTKQDEEVKQVEEEATRKEQSEQIPQEEPSGDKLVEEPCTQEEEEEKEAPAVVEEEKACAETVEEKEEEIAKEEEPAELEEPPAPVEKKQEEEAEEGEEQSAVTEPESTAVKQDAEPLKQDEPELVPNEKPQDETPHETAAEEQAAEEPAATRASRPRRSAAPKSEKKQLPTRASRRHQPQEDKSEPETSHSQDEQQASTQDLNTPTEEQEPAVRNKRARVDVAQSPKELHIPPAKPIERLRIKLDTKTLKNDKPKEKPTTSAIVDKSAPVEDSFRKFRCHDCGYSTDRLNNIVYHKKSSCQHLKQSWDNSVKEYISGLVKSPKSNKKMRFR